MSGGKVHIAVFDMPDASAEKAIDFQRSQLGKILSLTIFAPAVALRMLWKSLRRAM